MGTPYTPEFYRAVSDGAARSADVVVPVVLDYVQPATLIDVGCGTAAWARAFSDTGVRVRGIDGDYVPRGQLMIPAAQFTAVDLRHPFNVGGFDLAVALEVAEHLPASSAAGLVESLCKAAGVVLFSAAVPGQGGTDHINEQWPWYWRQLFLKCGFRMFDPIRPRILHDRRVAWWYRQNVFMFASYTLPDAPEVVDDWGLQIVAPAILGPQYLQQSGGSR